jgi:hypothetical protein
MAKLIWGKNGERTFETGVKQGVLFVEGDAVVWNGLISINDSPNGGSPQPYYQDGTKYIEVSEVEEYHATLEAFLSPPEFDLCDGTVAIHYGLFVTQQPRKKFGLAYRTEIGNDLEGLGRGYKIHLIYNAMASPTDREYASLSDSSDPIKFSWDLTATPVSVKGLAPTAHVIIDSTIMEPEVLTAIENMIYGTDSTSPYLPTPDELLTLIENTPRMLEIIPNEQTGLSPLVYRGEHDLIGVMNNGLYDTPPETRLNETETPGIYDLET